MPGAVEFGMSIPLAASDAAEPGEPWALEVPPEGRQGLGAGRNRASWPVCRDAKAAFTAGCLGSSSAAERLWLFPLSCFASAGEGQLSPWSGRVPGPPRLSQCLMCCQQAALVLAGEGWKVL